MSAWNRHEDWGQPWPLIVATAIIAIWGLWEVLNK